MYTGPDCPVQGLVRLSLRKYKKTDLIETELTNYSTNDIPSIYKYEDVLPEVYLEDISQKPSTFLHLPIEFILTNCKVVSQSNSVFLVKTAREAFQDRFRLR